MQRNRKLILWLVIFLIGLANLLLFTIKSSVYIDAAYTSNQALFYLPIIFSSLIILLSIFGAIGSSLSRETILDNYNRARIYAFIHSNPGIHFNEIIRKLDLSNGQTHWHLVCLKQFDMIRSVKTSQYVMYYPNEGNFSKLIDSIDRTLTLKSDTRNHIYDLISKHPSITQKDLKRIVKVSQSTLSYHLAILEQEGLIYNLKKERIRNYYAKEES